MLLFLWFTALIELYGPASQAGAVHIIPDIVFKEVDGTPVHIDLFLPAESEAPVPAVLFLNGGAWALNDRSDYWDFARAFARAGMVGITPDFRPTPPDGFQGQIDDVKDAIRWVRRHAAEYGIDPDALGIYGSSSGGHLAALAGMAGDGQGLSDDPPGESSALQAAFYLFGVYDLTDSPITFISRVLSRDGLPFGLTDEGLVRFSPITYASGNEPPTYMMHGERDFMVPLGEAKRLHDAMVVHDVPVTLHVAEGLGHGFIKTRPWLRPLIYWQVRTFFFETLGA